MKVNRQVIVDFVVSELEKGFDRAKIMAKVAKKWQIPTRTFDRYMKSAVDQHREKQNIIKYEKMKVDISLAVEARKSEILTVNERKEYLSKVVKGEVEIIIKEVRWHAEEKRFITIPIVTLPAHPTRIAAIAELNKMEGDYAPIKQDIGIRKLGAELEDEYIE